MTETLRDQLLGLGFKPKTPSRPDKAKPRRPGKSNSARRPDRAAMTESRGAKPDKTRSRDDIDLAKAYAIRAQREKQERIEAEQRKQEDARQRREARARLAELLEGKSLNAADADIARHFEYGGKIKRIHVTADQLKALNLGELGVLQMNGRYLLVAASLLAQAEHIFPPAVALKIEPDVPRDDDPYADPQYQVPDDLVW